MNQEGSRYRVELLTVLVAVRLLLQAQESTAPPPDQSAKVIFEVRQKGVMSRVFSRSSVGVKDAVQENYDLILEIRRLLTLCSYTLIPVQNPS